MMKKTAILLVAVALGVAACSSTSTEEAAANLCSSLSSLEATSTQVSSLGADSSVDDAQAAYDSVAGAWDDVKADAEVVNESAAQEADDAIESLKDALNDVSGDSSIADAAAQALTALQAFGAALESIDDSITCE
jgi:ABC-type glycerol-3-phosphate transport system substrate-binding protein